MRGNSPSTSRRDLFGHATGQPVAHCWAAFPGRKSAPTTPVPANLYARRQRPEDGELRHWRPKKDYDDLNGFLNNADELAEDLLAEGITAMKIWPSISPPKRMTGSISHRWS
jgi:L-alanine-DL-glutamate epimerase-like enolase superfamily enzyme